jgi:hypothetical protein
MRFAWISEQTVTFALCNSNKLVFITMVESVYSAVRTESLYKTDTLRLYRVNTVYIMALCFCFQNPPYSMLEKINERHTLRGSVGLVWRVLERRLNFTYV